MTAPLQLISEDMRGIGITDHELATMLQRRVEFDLYECSINGPNITNLLRRLVADLESYKNLVARP